MKLSLPPCIALLAFGLDDCGRSSVQDRGHLDAIYAIDEWFPGGLP